VNPEHLALTIAGADHVPRPGGSVHNNLDVLTLAHRRVAPLVVVFESPGMQMPTRSLSESLRGLGLFFLAKLELRWINSLPDEEAIDLGLDPIVAFLGL
jgi:hypothetical protein